MSDEMLLLAHNVPTDVWLVSFDICGFSNLLANPNLIFSSRAELSSAILKTQLISNLKGKLCAQFLGDEIRIAFPTNIFEITAIETFAKDVFTQLKKLPIRGFAKCGVLSYGTIPGIECAYFNGDVVDALNNESMAVSKNFFLIDKEVKQFGSVEDNLSDYNTSSRKINKSGFVVAITVVNKSKKSCVIELLESLGSVLIDDRGKKFTYSMGINSALIHVPDADAVRVISILEKIKTKILEPLRWSAAIAITQGEICSIPAEQGNLFIHSNFEGPPAIIATRILSKITLGELAWSKHINEHLKTLHCGSFETKIIKGKREEKFEINYNSNYALFGDDIPRSVIMELKNVKLSDSKIKQFCDALEIPVSFFDILSNADDYEILELAKLAVCLHIANVMSRLANDDPLFKKTTIKDSLGSAAYLILTNEFAIWKRFHSVAGNMFDFCDIITERYRKIEHEEIDVIRRGINDVVVDFGDKIKDEFVIAVRKLVLEGYNPLIKLLTKIDNVKDRNFEPFKSLNGDFNDFSFIDWNLVFDELFNEFTVEQSEKIKSYEVFCTDSMHSEKLSEELRYIISTRNSAIRNSLKLTAALYSLISLFRLHKTGWSKNHMKISELKLREELSEIVTYLKNSPYSVVLTSNSTLFAWIDIFKVWAKINKF